MLFASTLSQIEIATLEDMRTHRCSGFFHVTPSNTSFSNNLLRRINEVSLFL
jgi:hypothetical protein